MVPGITGWAQVHYQAAYNVADSYEKFRYNLFYGAYWQWFVQEEAGQGRQTIVLPLATPMVYSPMPRSR